MASLLALSRSEQERAKRLLRGRYWAHAGTLVLGLLALALSEPAVYVLAACALGTEGTAWYLRFLAGEAHGRAEQGRRRALISSQLGLDPDSLGSASVRAEFSSAARADAHRWEDPDYYSSTVPPGPERLHAALQESAFWSCCLFRVCARRTAGRLAVVVVVLIGATLALFSVAATSTAEAVARAVTVVLGTLITADLLSTVAGYFAAARTSERVVTRLDQVDPHDHGQMLAVFGDYTTATAQASPIPSALYRRHHDAIDEAWRSR